MPSEQKIRGQTYTPELVSTFLVNWAIESFDDTVLEPSVGEGRFVFDAYNRFKEIGAFDPQEQVYGVDIDDNAVDNLQTQAENEIGSSFENIESGDIFTTEFPEVDCVVGNPPYVIRHRFENADDIIHQYSEQYNFSNQSDLYVYFLLRASEFLKPGGRLAMIVSNSWMKKKYGEEFKQFLLDDFYIKGLIGFRERVFGDLINSVCILAEKRPNTITIPSDNEVRFIQANSVDIFDGGNLSLDELSDTAVQSASVPQKSISAEDYWDIWLRAPDVFETIKNSSNFVSLNKFAKPKIGIQTLAKDFYVLSQEDVDEHQIEQEYLRPIAYSPRDHQNPTIQDCQYYVFWCSEPKSELAGTYALEYIETAENRIVEKRYSDETYDGLHNKTRIKNANREPWYNLKDESERRLPSEILLPRRVYENYTAVWNPGGVIPNENFLATSVEDETHVKPLLTYLNSKLGELNLRLSGQVYGGGVCDLNVSSSKSIQTINLNNCTTEDIDTLTEAFDNFVENNNREVLDEAVYSTLDMNETVIEEIEEALEIAINESLSKNN